MSFQHQEIKLRRKCPFLTSCSKACSHLQVSQLLWAQDEATHLVPKLACSRKAVGFWDCCFLGQCLGQKMKAVIKSQSFTSLFFLLCAWGGGTLAEVWPGDGTHRCSTAELQLQPPVVSKAHVVEPTANLGKGAHKLGKRLLFHCSKNQLWKLQSI